MPQSPSHPLRLLHIDSSARFGRSGHDARGSHSRRLSHRFVARWISKRPDDLVIRRDVAKMPPTPVDADWIDAAFTPCESRSPAQSARLAESDQLVAELLVIGAPMYNFGLPSQLKAWIDNIVRVGGPSVSIDRAMASHIGRCCRAANGLSSCLRARITVMIRVGAWRQ